MKIINKKAIVGILGLVLTTVLVWAGRNLEITKQPENQTVKAGDSVTFSVEVEEDENVEFAMDMVWCPPGTFTMGSPETELDRFSIEYRHQEIISQGFWLGKYELTQSQYQAVMGRNPSEFVGSNNPVEQVTWYDAIEFCTKLTSIERAAGRLPKGYEYTLPTEVQWEYACRAGTTTALNNGKSLTSKNECPNMDEVGWYRYNSNDTTHPVGQKKPNAWGLYDMHGNVWEWCLNGYTRGGSWFNRAGFCRSAKRLEIDPNNSANIRGFRVALVLTQAQASAAASALTYQWYKDGVNIDGAIESSYTIEAVKKEDEGSYWVKISNGTDTVTSDTATLTVEAADPPTLTMYRVKSEGLANASQNYGTDEPLIPVTDEDQLAVALEPVSEGLVADGVTPLVFKLHFPGKSEKESQWKLNCIEDYVPCFFHLLKDGRFHSLSRSELSRGGTVLTVPAHPEGEMDLYLYLEGVPSDEADLGSSPCILKVSSIENEEICEELEFKICPPPLVLIHGFNTKGEWGEGFKRRIARDREKSLVYELHYGVSGNDTKANTYGTFEQLTKLLNKTLQTDVEGLQGSTLWEDWACTRYDVVAHCQGGVLTRLLCSKDPVWGGAYRGKANHYRGRFNRIVTIGSPQNGTSLVYYLREMKKKSFSLWFGKVLPNDLFYLYQSRFDPWGKEIRKINNVEVDPAAKFHAVSTEVNPKNKLFVLLGLYLGEFGYPGLGNVFPDGSDYIVDMDSQEAGAIKSSHFKRQIGVYVAHAPLFGWMSTDLDKFDHTQTTDTSLAMYVNELFEDNNNFGSFYCPTPAPESWRKDIDNSMMAISVEQTLLEFGIGKIIKIIDEGAGLAYNIINTYFFIEDLAQVKSAADNENETVWIAEVYGPNGVTMDGVTLEEDNEHVFGVNVVVEDSVDGEVVLYGCVQTADGKLYYGKPTVVYSNPPGERIVSIECVPSTLTMMTGDTIEPELWATYENGVKSRLFVGMDTPLTYRSSDARIIEVNGHELEALKDGKSVITAEYKGLRTTLQYTVGNDDSSAMLFNRDDDGLSLVFTGTLQESTDMMNWKTLEEAKSPYTVQPTDEQKFYRCIF